MLSVLKKVLNVCLNLLFICLLAVVMPGCDNSLDPLDEEKGIYSIFGFLDINREVNFIRVKNLNIPNIKDSVRSIQATVTVTNLESNTTQILQDSVVKFSGVVTHNFKTTMNILPLTTYRVKVEKEDGRAVTATATTPNRTIFTVKPVKQSFNTPITFKFNPIHPETFVELRIYMILIDPYGKIFWDVKLYPNRTVNFNGVLSVSISPYRMLYQYFCTPISCPFPITRNLLHSDKLTAKYFHYGQHYKGDRGIITDTLEIEAATGRFFGAAVDAYTFQIDL